MTYISVILIKANKTTSPEKRIQKYIACNFEEMISCEPSFKKTANKNNVLHMNYVEMGSREHCSRFRCRNSIFLFRNSIFMISEAP